MTEEHEEFEQWLKVPPPAASEEARKRAILRGMDAFDQYFSEKRQGSDKPNRLMEAIRTFHHSIFGDNPMKTPQLIGGLCTIAIGVALLSSSSLTSLFPKSETELQAVDALQSKQNDASPFSQKERQLAEERKAKRISGYVVLPTPAEPKKSEISSTTSSNKPVAQVEKDKNDAIEGSTLKGITAEREKIAADDRNEPAPAIAAISSLAQTPGDLPVPPATTMAQDRLAAPEQRMAEKALAAPLSPPPVAAAPMDMKKSAAIANGGTVMSNFATAPGFAGAVAQAPADAMGYSYHDDGRDKFEHVKSNSIKVVKEEPVSTFSIDVDTSSYSFMRTSLNNNVLPQKDAVRVEEFVNYFPYEYESPESKEAPFKANVAVMPTPWNSKTKLIHIGIKGYQIEQKEKPHANLVFLIDTSGSMNEPNKLPLLKNSLKLLLDSLKPDDTVGIVTYAGNAGVALEPTSVKDKHKILAAIESFNAGGSTAGAEGIRQAYQLAEKNLDKSGVNRVILATDGDFNVGITDQNELKSYIERERNTGIFLSVLGFGMGNYNDAMMQTLAQNGNGNAAYIDNLSEARKALVEEASSTLFTIAKDVKIQVEFNPAKVAEYRLIGYETRMLNREDFNNDKVDAGDIGSGHTVTALYEITPTGSDAKLVDNLRYQASPEEKQEGTTASLNEYAFVKIRYKQPDGDTSKLITTPVDGKVEAKEFTSAPQEARFATAVAAFAQLLRGDSFTKDYSYDDVITIAQAAKGADGFGYRAEFINLVRLAAHAAKLPAQQGNGGVVPMIGGMPSPTE